MHKYTVSHDALFQYRGLPPVGLTVSMALQHLVSMIVGCVTPAIIIANAVGLPHDQRVLLIQASLVMSAVTTLLQLFPIAGRFGAGLPVIFGVSFAYLPSMLAIAAGSGGLGAVAGAMLVGGAVAAVVGLFIKPIRRLFPPVITGTVVFTIGLSLYPTAINYMAGGSGNTYQSVVVEKGLSPALVYGSWQNWAIAAFTLTVVLLLSNHGRGICKLASILLGILAGYAVAFACGMVDLSGIAGAAWFSLPHFLPSGISFEPSACIALGLLFAINSIQAIGDLTATTVGGMDREPTDRELQGGIVAYGVSNILTALLGGLPTDGDEHHAIDNTFLAVPMNKGLLGAALVAVFFLLLLWRLAKKHRSTETICLLALTLYLFMENKPFLLSANPFLLLAPIVFFESITLEIKPNKA